MEDKEIFTHGGYLFVFAHPDDDVYVGHLLRKIMESGKRVRLVFLTSGDQGLGKGRRKQEVYDSCKEIGVTVKDIVFLYIPELEVLGCLREISRSVIEIAEDFEPDCVIGMDYEGGHEVHDAASFVASAVVGRLACSHYVFPVYHMEDGKRVAGQFLPDHDGKVIEVPMSFEEADVSKIHRYEAYRSQIGHFLGLEKQSPGYFQRMFAREIYRRVSMPIDYTVRPCDEIGYEKHKNGFKFSDFEKAVISVSDPC